MGRKCTKEEFIEKARSVHGDKYDYSKVEYIDNRTKVCIMCPVHGEFWQAPDKHIGRKQGCPMCSGNKKKTREQFIEEAVGVHGDKYDYSKVIYNGTHNKVCIICHEKDENGKEHGEFLQTPRDHLHGQGCPKCKGKKIWGTRGRLTVEDVKKQFEEVHGDKYDYSLFTEYKNSSTKIPVICREHGVFYITPNAHISAHKGCSKCGTKSSSEKQRLSLVEAVKRIRIAHGDRYAIPKDFKYVNSQNKVKLICGEHGEFWQNPFNLWKSVGCPKCNRSKLENEMSVFLDSIGIKYEEQKKFTFLGNSELDFYLPNYNVAIECQGIQHFKGVGHFGGEEQYAIQQENDAKKRALCEENGLRLLYFSSEQVKSLLGHEFPYEVYTDKELLLKAIKS